MFPKYEEVNRKLADFAKLPNGWNYGRGVAPPLERIKAAQRLLSFGATLLFNAADVFPGTEGEIEVAFYYGPYRLGCLLETDGDIFCELEDDKKTELPEEQCETVNNAIDFMRRMADKIIINEWDK